MRVSKTALTGVLLIEPELHQDARGSFMELYSRKAFQAIGIDTDFVQDNESVTLRKGTIRGLHYQNNPKAQAKLVRCARGKVLDVVVDLRRGSPTYLEHFTVELSEDNRRMLFIPRGFAHGFLSLTDDVVFNYKVDNDYAPEQARSIRFDDPQLGIDWGIKNPILSQADLNAPGISEVDYSFSYEEVLE